MFVQQYWWNGTGGSGLLIHGTGMVYVFTGFCGNGTGLVFISIPVSLFSFQFLSDRDL